MVINLCLHLLEIAGLGKSRQACSGNVLSPVLLTSLMVWSFFLFFSPGDTKHSLSLNFLEI